MNKEIYLDYAANTPVDREVLRAFDEATMQYFGNPNSTHKLGLEAKNRIDEASSNIMNCIQSELHLNGNFEMIYTSGSSESNNLAIKGVCRTYRENGRHIITSFLEHSSVSGPLSSLKDQGYEVDVVNILPNGKVDVQAIRELMRKDTVLVSICSVDGELGTIQPIEEIAQIVKEYPNCMFHVDATQSIGKIKMNFENVDLITFAPHKFYGLNGFGALLKRKEIVLEPLIHGGTSTSLYRSGTPVTGQIVAMEKALELAIQEEDNRFAYVSSLNRYLRENLAKYDKVQINSLDERNPYILNLGVKEVKATDFKKELEKYGVCVSIKSACSVTATPSRSVMAMTKDRKRAFSSWRISLSHLTTKEELEKFMEIFDVCYQSMTT
ncbi:MAG: cysteine desulfurase [Clostridia bacterium]|nr:cysteine desulfurase [Clostridia bacterium]